MAIRFLFQDDFRTAFILFSACLIFDFLDGLAARLLKAGSETGKQLDSLADIISFGLLPSLLAMKWIEFHDEGSYLVYFSFLFLIAAAWRLAIFNTDESQKAGFKGLATPAAAIMVMSIPLLKFSNSELLLLIQRSPYVILLIVLGLSFLMISRIPMLALKFKKWGFQETLPFLILVTITLLIAVFNWPLAIFCLIPLYILVSLFFNTMKETVEED